MQSQQVEKKTILQFLYQSQKKKKKKKKKNFRPHSN